MSDTTAVNASPKTYLEKILSLMEIPGTVAEQNLDESTMVYRIDCNDADAKLLIGRKGQTLEALQFLLRQMCKGAQGEEEHFVLDVLDYRERRKEAIIDRAKKGAVAVLNGEYEEYALPPMSAFERRIVHNYLHEEFPELASQSAGEGSERHIVVSYLGEPEGESAPQES
jgi:spoIIIJ-associated protein